MNFEINDHHILAEYMHLLNSRKRNQWFKQAIDESCRDKIVLDVGTGTGLLAHYALEAGAKFVYCIESEITAARLADEVLAECHDRSRFKIIHCDFMSSEIEEHLPKNSIDVLVSETVGWAIFEQGILDVWQGSKQFMKQGGVAIPSRITLDVMMHDPIEYVGESSRTILGSATLSEPYSEALEKVNASMEYSYTLPINIDRVPRKCQRQYDLLDVRFSDESHSLIFNIVIDKPQQITIVGNIYDANDSNKLTISDCNDMGWNQLPSLYIPKAGPYSIRFQHNTFNQNYWIFNKLD